MIQIFSTPATFVKNYAEGIHQNLNEIHYGYNLDYIH